MSGDGTPEVRDDWKRRTGRCTECDFDWAEPGYETLVGQCVHAVAVFGEVLSRVEPSEAVEPGLWSASRYVWHTVDVLRFGTERLWTISADPAFGVPSWDENVVAEVRSYDALSPVVGLIALHRRGPCLARGRDGSSTRRHDGSLRGRADRRLRHRAAQRPRGLPSPVGRPTGTSRGGEQEHPDRNLTATSFCPNVEQFSRPARQHAIGGSFAPLEGLRSRTLRRRRSALGVKLARQGRILADSFDWASGELGLVHHSSLRRGDARVGWRARFPGAPKVLNPTVACAEYQLTSISFVSSVGTLA